MYFIIFSKKIFFWILNRCVADTIIEFGRWPLLHTVKEVVFATAPSNSKSHLPLFIYLKIRCHLPTTSRN